MADAPPIVLASESAARRSLLTSAGVPFEAVASRIDEAALREGYARDGLATAPREIALRLARAKAEDVASRRKKAIVIGADQVLAADVRALRGAGRRKPGNVDFKSGTISKARTIDEAREVLRLLRGTSHFLHSAVVVMGGEDAPWEYVADARLVMRNFTGGFLDRYLDIEGEDVCASVGGYKVEGRGIQLFETIDGDHSAILGLPLLPLLAEVRRRGALPA